MQIPMIHARRRRHAPWPRRRSMIAVIFEVEPPTTSARDISDIAATLRPQLSEIDGFSR